MPDLPREPEWHQQPGRDVHRKDAVLNIRPIARFEYSPRRPMTSIDHTLVFATADGTYEVFVPPHRPRKREAARRHFVAVYEIDTGSHVEQLELELPSNDDAFPFGATVDLTWHVHDAVRYVRSGERDVPRRLTQEFQQAARPVSRYFPVAQSQDAELAVQKAVSCLALGEAAGLTVSCQVHMRLDTATVEHRRRLREIEHQHGLLDPSHAYEMQRARQAHELEVLKQQQQQALVAARLDFYRHHLQHNGVERWALHLAEHPEDMGMVIRTLGQEQLAVVRSQLELIKGDSLEDHQKSGVAGAALHVLNEMARQHVLPDPQSLPPAPRMSAGTAIPEAPDPTVPRPLEATPTEGAAPPVDRRNPEAAEVPPRPQDLAHPDREDGA